MFELKKIANYLASTFLFREFSSDTNNNNRKHLVMEYNMQEHILEILGREVIQINR